MKRVLFVLVGLSLIFSAHAKEIFISRYCNESGCADAYALTGKDVVPYQKPTREQQFREDLKKEIKWQRVCHADYANLTDEQVVEKMVKEMIKEP